MNNFLQQVYFNNTVLDYAIVLVGLLILWYALKLLKQYIIRLLQRKAHTSKTQLDDVVISAIDKFVVPLSYISINYLLINRLNITTVLDKVIDNTIIIVWIYFSVRILNHVLQNAVCLYMRHKGETEQRISQVTGMLLVIKAVIWIIGILVFLSNIGVNVTAAITGFGIGGIAIALATQNILGDLFSYFVIFFDKPFEVGDAINVNGHAGTVEYIGIKTSQVRSLDGQQLVIPNAEMVKSTIQNYKRLTKRRGVVKIGVAHHTAIEKLIGIPPAFKDIIANMPNCSFDRANLINITETSINYEVAFFVNTDDYTQYITAVEQVNILILQFLKAQRIDIAIPTRTIQVKNDTNGTFVKIEE